MYKQQIESQNEKRTLQFEDLRNAMREFGVSIHRPAHTEDL